jgi:hypothetical protein
MSPSDMASSSFELKMQCICRPSSCCLQMGWSLSITLT